MTTTTWSLVENAIRHQGAANCPCCKPIYKALREGRTLERDEALERVAMESAMSVAKELVEELLSTDTDMQSHADLIERAEAFIA